MRPVTWTAGRLRELAALLGRDSLRVGIWMAAGGGALALGNLIFAAVLTPSEFGALTLIEALLSVGVGISPLGYDTLAVRGEMEHDPRSMRLAAAPLAVGALLFSAAAYGFVREQFAPLYLVPLVVGCAGGALGRYCAAFEQNAIRLDRAQLIDQSPLLLVFAGALVCAVVGIDDLLVASSVVAGGYAVSGAVGFGVFRRSGKIDPEGPDRGADDETTPLDRKERWLKALTFLAISASGLLMGQIERFIIPRTLTLADLGVFGVAWTVAGSPYKLLSGGIGYALLPKLRSAESHRERRRLVRGECLLAAVLGGGGFMVLMIAGPWITDLLYGGKYPVDHGLIAMVVLLGMTRVAYSVANAIIVGTGEGRALTKFNVGSWAALAFAVAAAVALSPFGTTGILAGVSVGWLARTALALYFSPG